MQSLVLYVTLAVLGAASARDLYRICVPESVIEDCKKMVEESKATNLQCVHGRDRLDCLGKMEKGDADFEVLDPEDMYLAGKLSDESFSVFKEIRTLVEPDAEFRYDGVAVIPKALSIDNLHGLKGLKSCHTGVGRNVGYKIPITKLTKQGILGPLSHTDLSPRENELKALSEFFSKACIVGKWSSHPDIDRELKKKYFNLCEMCEHPSKCDYPDIFSGYEGALKCLTENGGQIAWTKVIYVKKFFGLSPKGAEQAHSPEDYVYLCPDASKKPITGPPCAWASRPWPGYMGHKVDKDDVKTLRGIVTKLYEIGNPKHAPWLESVLNQNNETVPRDNEGPYTPMKYLEKAKYDDVIERDVLAPRRVVRICVSTSAEMKKCNDLKQAAYSRDVRPSFGCEQLEDDEACMAALQKGKAEAAIMDAFDAIAAEKHELKPLLQETYGKEVTQKFVAIVPKSSTIRSITDMESKKACVPTIPSAGYVATMATISTAQKPKTVCPIGVYVRNKFFASVKDSDDPMECLLSKEGDVAFVPVPSLEALKDSDFEAICMDGRHPIEDAKQCDLPEVPPRLVMVHSNLTNVELGDIKFSFLESANFFAKNPKIFHMFGGKYEGKPNVLFSAYTTGLDIVPDNFERFCSFKKMVKDIEACSL